MEQSSPSTNISLSFMSNQGIEIPKKIEVVSRGKEYVSYGSNNLFPNYLYETYQDCSTLQSIINGTTDFIVGNGVTGFEFINSLGEDLETIIRKLSIHYLIYGGFALYVKKDALLKVIDIQVYDFKNGRLNEEVTKFYYSKDWGKWGSKAIEYPLYKETLNESVYYFRTLIVGDEIYPIPKYYGALKSCRTQIEIQNFHYNNISNGFMPSAIINFNNGMPTPEVRKEIERKFDEKFTGSSNASKIVYSWNDNKDSAVTINRLEDNQFDKKYEALFNTTRNTIFSSMSAQPVLFGQSLEGIGFNSQEFEEAFNLYNRTVVLPIQKQITKVLNMLFNTQLTIIPFSLN